MTVDPSTPEPTPSQTPRPPEEIPSPPAKSRAAGPPRFQRKPRSPETAPRSPEQERASGFEGAASDPLSQSSTTTGRPSRASTDGDDPKTKRLFETNKKALVGILKKGIRAGTGVPHRLLTTPEQHDAGLYLADPTDEADIAVPLAGIMARRGIVPGTTDLADIIELAIAVTAYLVRQVQLRAQIAGREIRIVDVTPVNVTAPADPVG